MEILKPDAGVFVEQECQKCGHVFRLIPRRDCRFVISDNGEAEIGGTTFKLCAKCPCCKRTIPVEIGTDVLLGCFLSHEP